MDGFGTRSASSAPTITRIARGSCSSCACRDRRAAERDYFEHVHYFYQKCLNVWEGFAEAPGYRTLKTLQAGMRPQLGAQGKQVRQSLDWKKYVDQGYVIAGSPATVREQLTDCIKSLRVGHLMVLLQIGSMPKELTFKNTQLFATEVMPHVRDLWRATRTGGAIGSGG